MKKIISLGFILLFVVSLVGCNQNTTDMITTVDISTDTTTESQIDVNDSIYQIYQLALEANATTDSYEDWLESVRGPQGETGKSINLQVADGFIQWQYSGDTLWTNLVELTTLVGPAGADGVNGIDGKQVTFQVSEGFIQWQYVGDTSWTNLIDLQTITGADGTNGTDGVDGREVLFQVAGGDIQWQ